MIDQHNFAIEPWAIREDGLDIDRLGHTESVFALANGHLGLRGNLDEGDPHGTPGTYLNSFFDTRPLPYAEAGYGYPESGQTIINVTNGKLIRLLVDDEPFDIRYGELRRHERRLDFRAGTLSRTAEWASPAGRAIRVRSQRLVSLTQRAVAAISFEVEAVDRPVRLVLQSELFANEELPAAEDDPRVAALLSNPLVPEQHRTNDTGATLLHRTRNSGLRMAATMEHLVEGPSGTQFHTSAGENVARTTVICRLESGQRLRVVKFLAYGWSSRRSIPALYDQVRAAISAARYTGWEGLCTEQRRFLDEYWASADVEVEGNPQLQQAVRFALFHVMQAGARAEGRAIAAKALTGAGYDGHTFWDTETFVLPMLSHTLPDAAADALRWRRSTLPTALEHATTLGLKGAAFPWRTIRGQECSGYWPAGTAAFHINADIADAAIRHVTATGDVGFERDVAAELLVQTARLWISIGHFDGADFRIDGVTGPDEYSAIADNNVYTNLLAQRNLRAAAAVAAKFPDRAAELAVTDDEVASWSAAAEAMFVPFDAELGVHPQSEGFTSHARWDFAGTAAEQYPVMLHFPYFDIYRKQIVKQADLVLAMQLCPEAFTPEQKRRNFAYYEQITVRDSSLSAATQAVLAAETGHLDLAHDYLAETATLDLADLAGNTAHGVHLAALAGTWTAIVVGFGGLRHLTGDRLALSPRLPDELDGIAFRLLWRGRRLQVWVTRAQVEYTLLEGPEMTLWHHGEPVTLTAGEPSGQPVPRPAPVEAVAQPPGREPLVRRLRTAGFRGAIFDVDGVLVDSPHEVAWRESLRELMESDWAGFAEQTGWTPAAFTPELYQRELSGKPRMDGAVSALKHFGVPDVDVRAAEYAERKQAMVLRLIEEGAFDAYSDALRFVLALKRAGLKLAAASSSRNAPLMLRQIRMDPVEPGDTRQLAELFDADISGKPMPHGKPAPDIFLAAAAELGLDPERCLVVEDAPSGIRAAKAGGMAALGIARADDEHLLAAERADVVVTSLDLIDLDELVHRGRLDRRPV